HKIVRSDQQVGFSRKPLSFACEGWWLRHCRKVTFGRPGIKPLHDGLDVTVAQRNIILVPANTYRLIEMPRRHVTHQHALLDRTSPWTRVLVSHERHRCDGSFMMTRRAAFVEDRRHFFRKRLRARWGHHRTGEYQHDYRHKMFFHTRDHVLSFTDSFSL